MGFEVINHTTIALLITLIILGGVFYHYIDRIENYVLRNVILAATRLVLVSQDTTDLLTQPAWRKIATFIGEMNSLDTPISVAVIFNNLILMLNNELKSLESSEESAIEIKVIQKAIHLATIWRFIVYNEIVNSKPVRVAPRRFVDVILTNVDV